MTDKKEFTLNPQTMEIFKEAPEKATGEFLLVGKADDLVECFKENKDGLVKLSEAVKGKVVIADVKKSAKKLAAEIFDAAVKKLYGGASKPAASGKGTSTPRAESKLSKLRAKLVPGKTVTKQELSDASGYDLPNTHTAMSILKNPERTKEPIFYTYNKKDQSYTIYEDEKSMLAAIRAEAKAADEAEKAAKKAAEEAAKKDKK